MLYTLLTEKPAQPEELVVTEVTSEHATLAWQQPHSDGGAPVLSYVIKLRRGENSEFERVSEIDAAAGPCSHVVRKLDEQTPYWFSVTACNEVGHGDPLVTPAPVVTKSAISKSVCCVY